MSIFHSSTSPITSFTSPHHLPSGSTWTPVTAMISTYLYDWMWHRRTTSISLWQPTLLTFTKDEVSPSRRQSWVSSLRGIGSQQSTVMARLKLIIRIGVLKASSQESWDAEGSTWWPDDYYFPDVEWAVSTTRGGTHKKCDVSNCLKIYSELSNMLS